MLLPKLLLLFFLSSSSIAYDIIIYSATPSGIAAAITAARASSSISIAIIEPTNYIGGMAAAGGIGLRDLGLADTSELTLSLSILSIHYLQSPVPLHMIGYKIIINITKMSQILFINLI